MQASDSELSPRAQRSHVVRIRLVIIISEETVNPMKSNSENEAETRSANLFISRAKNILKKVSLIHSDRQHALSILLTTLLLLTTSVQQAAGRIQDGVVSPSQRVQ